MECVKGILLLGGSGDRFGDPTPKQFHLLGDRPLYMWTLDQLVSSNLLHEIILVCPEQYIEEIQEETKEAHPIISGGPTRQTSSCRGILACGDDTDYVLIHDAVRPFVSERILRENIAAVKEHKAIDTCIPSADTLVYAPQGSVIEKIPNRSAYLRGQTPQTFSYPLIRKAHEKTTQKNATDDCQLVLELGHPVHIVHGSESNIKITSPEDMTLAHSMHPIV